jgi:hypothetical protein
VTAGLAPETAAPLTVTVRRYECPFCHRRRSSRAVTAEHMGRCWLNPDVRSCKTCANFEESYDACGCEPGCNWGSPSGPAPASCAAGRDLPEGAEFPVTGCPLWAALEAS